MTVSARRWALGLGLAAAWVAVACNGGDTTSSSSSGSTLDTGLPPNKSAAELTPAEVTQFCDAMADVSTTLLPDSCKFSAALTAGMQYLLSGTTDVAALRETCRTARDACLSTPAETTACTGPTDCTATVAEIEACLNASLAKFKQQAAQLPACESLELSDFESDPSAAATEDPPECVAIQETCPGLLEDESSGSNFACSDGSSIPESWVCDGMNDCDGGEDEASCASSSAGFTCTDGSWIPSSWVCDGMNDCDGGEDEASC